MVVASASSPTPRRPVYAKGDETRRSILKAALAEFGDHGFGATTTRSIATRAQVALPALGYYFGSKEGVYRACAAEIAERYAESMATLPTEIAKTQLGTAAPLCAIALRQVVRHLAGFLAASEDAQNWSAFVSREMQERGPAFDFLYSRLWAPGVQRLASLIAGAKGVREVRDEDRVDALMLVSSLVAFQSGRGVSFRVLAWSELDDRGLNHVLATVDRLVDGIVGTK